VVTVLINPINKSYMRQTYMSHYFYRQTTDVGVPSAAVLEMWQGLPSAGQQRAMWWWMPHSQSAESNI